MIKYFPEGKLGGLGEEGREKSTKVINLPSGRVGHRFLSFPWIARITGHEAGVTGDSSRGGLSGAQFHLLQKVKKTDSPGLGFRIPTCNASSGTSGKMHEHRYQID